MTGARGCRDDRTQHAFAAGSGWCANNCGVRNDGRIVNRTGTLVLVGPAYGKDAEDQAEIERIIARLRDDRHDRSDREPRNR